MNPRILNQSVFLIVVGILALLVSACAPNVLASKIEVGNLESDAPLVSQPLTNYPKGGQFSGDDAYDPAAKVSLTNLHPSGRLSYSGDDAYDPAAASNLTAPAAVQRLKPPANSFSGDDAYDPAAGGLQD